MHEGELNLQEEVLIDVLFYDVDSMHVVYHANYFRYFEEARTALLRSFNYDYPAMGESGYMWPVIECKCRFMRPIRYGMKIRVVAILKEYLNRLKINYEIYDTVSGARLSKGHTVQVAVSIETEQMLYESPPVLLAKLGVAP